MNIGIIVHSHTGNTLSVSQKLEESFLKAGHSAKIERVTAVNEDPNAAKNCVLKTAPDVRTYDTLVFAAPVRGFALSPVMKLYLSGISSLSGKKVGLFVTQTFPRPWMGGNQAMRQMKEACEQKNAAVLKTGIINWKSSKREEQIKSLVDAFTKL